MVSRIVIITILAISFRCSVPQRGLILATGPCWSWVKIRIASVGLELKSILLKTTAHLLHLQVSTSRVKSCLPKRRSGHSPETLKFYLFLDYSFLCTYSQSFPHPVSAT